MKEFVVAYEDVQAEDAGEDLDEKFVEFDIVDRDKDGEETNRRTLRAYPPTDGQLAFMLAALGRGQTQDQRFAAIVNIMMSAMRDEDQDYLESRLLSRDPNVRLPLKAVEQIFEGLTEEWFANPTQPASDSASSPQKDGPKSTQRTTK